MTTYYFQTSMLDEIEVLIYDIVESTLVLECSSFILVLECSFHTWD